MLGFRPGPGARCFYTFSVSRRRGPAKPVKLAAAWVSQGCLAFGLPEGSPLDFLYPFWGIPIAWPFHRLCFRRTVKPLSLATEIQYSPVDGTVPRLYSGLRILIPCYKSCTRWHQRDRLSVLQCTSWRETAARFSHSNCCTWIFFSCRSCSNDWLPPSAVNATSFLISFPRQQPKWMLLRRLS